MLGKITVRDVVLPEKITKMTIFSYFSVGEADLKRVTFSGSFFQERPKIHFGQDRSGVNEEILDFLQNGKNVLGKGSKFLKRFLRSLRKFVRVVGFHFCQKMVLFTYARKMPA